MCDEHFLIYDGTVTGHLFPHLREILSPCMDLHLYDDLLLLVILGQGPQKTRTVDKYHQ